MILFFEDIFYYGIWISHSHPITFAAVSRDPRVTNRAQPCYGGKMMRTTRQKQREMKSFILHSSVLSTEIPSTATSMFCYVVFAPAFNHMAWVCSSAASMGSRVPASNKLKTSTTNFVFYHFVQREKCDKDGPSWNRE